MPRLALYQPDIPQNLGAALRLCACFDIPLEVIEPCAFPLDEKRIKRSGMDYVGKAELTRHANFSALKKAYSGSRILLLTTKAASPYTSFTFKADDILLLGRESAGVPEEVHQSTDVRLLIPMAEGARSLNVIMAGAIVLGEARRQLALP